MKNLFYFFMIFTIVGCSSDDSKLYPQDTDSLTQRVLFLTNSTFHASGGAMDPFNGYCESTESNFKAFGSYGTPEGQRISPFINGQISDDRILDLINSKQFAYVMLVTRYNAILTEEDFKKELEAFQVMHEHIARSGARTVVSISYITREDANDLEIQKNVLSKHEIIKNVLDNTIIDGKKFPIILVPTGLLWTEGISEFGIDSWFADKNHGTPLAQHASGCLFFTFITGQDPRVSDYNELYTGYISEVNEGAFFSDKELTKGQAEWLRNIVWALYEE
jgi:hypothetical protein